MVQYLYSLHDNKSGVWQAPCPDFNDSTAKRNLAAGLHSTNDLRIFAPADFELYCVGTFDSASGAVTAQLPVYICSCADLLREDVYTNAEKV